MYLKINGNEIEISSDLANPKNQYTLNIFNVPWFSWDEFMEFLLSNLILTYQVNSMRIQAPIDNSQLKFLVEKLNQKILKIFQLHEKSRTWDDDFMLKFHGVDDTSNEFLYRILRSIPTNDLLGGGRFEFRQNFNCHVYCGKTLGSNEHYCFVLKYKT